MIDSPKLDDAVSVLPAEEFDFRFAFAGSGQYDPAPGFEEPIVFERQFNPYCAFQPLGFRDPSDRNEGGFRMTDEALLQNLERKPLFQLHSRGAEDGPD
jgi:hypothetical protein